MKSKTPNGFRAVRMRGKTEVVYCVERHGEIDSIAVYGVDGGIVCCFDSRAFNATHAREYSPMPDAVRAMFEGKPSFADWWASKEHSV